MWLTFSLCIKIHKINTMQRERSSHHYITLQSMFYNQSTEEVTRCYASLPANITILVFGIQLFVITHFNTTILTFT